MLELYRLPTVRFVFGSNLSGIHGAGAAAYAHKHWGAKWGVGEGLTGRSYALPTKDHNVQTTLPLTRILQAMRALVDCAHDHEDLIFLVTPVGCGLAGLKEETVKGLLIEAGGPTKNMLFTASWFDPKVF